MVECCMLLEFSLLKCSTAKLSCVIQGFYCWLVQDGQFFFLLNCYGSRVFRGGVMCAMRDCALTLILRLDYSRLHLATIRATGRGCEMKLLST